MGDLKRTGATLARVEKLRLRGLALPETEVATGATVERTAAVRVPVA
jgi:hypothetical protein